MKKLTKLNINPEKVMKHEELIRLKGGYGEGIGIMYYCTCTEGANPPYDDSWWGCYHSQEEIGQAYMAHCYNYMGNCTEYFLC